ncbi:MAG: hypothetical protein GKS06_11455 [Acidobacteria bacterium]|nr:hypothetical protein [Acidobacteriota bacterium]
MNQPTGLNTLIGLATAGTAVVGLFALVGGLLVFTAGEFVAAALFLLAAAVAFGALAIALLRS